MVLYVESKYIVTISIKKKKNHTMPFEEKERKFSRLTITSVQFIYEKLDMQ